MCGCSSSFNGEKCNCNKNNMNNNFVDDELNFVDSSLANFDGGGSMTDFVDDGEDDNFDNFLTKKMRERRQVRKALEGEGLTKKEARAKALEQVPRQKLKEIIAKLKKGESAMVNGQVVGSGDLDVVSSALNNGSNTTTTGNANDLGTDTEEAGFMSKYGLYIGIGAVVLVGGYFAYKKFGK